jgi:hypothetical protein
LGCAFAHGAHAPRRRSAQRQVAADEQFEECGAFTVHCAEHATAGCHAGTAHRSTDGRSQGQAGVREKFHPRIAADIQFHRAVGCKAHRQRQVAADIPDMGGAAHAAERQVAADAARIEHTADVDACCVAANAANADIAADSAHIRIITDRPEHHRACLFDTHIATDAASFDGGALAATQAQVAVQITEAHHFRHAIGVQRSRDRADRQTLHLIDADIAGDIVQYDHARPVDPHITVDGVGHAQPFDTFNRGIAVDALEEGVVAHAGKVHVAIDILTSTEPGAVDGKIVLDAAHDDRPFPQR